MCEAALVNRGADVRATRAMEGNCAQRGKERRKDTREDGKATKLYSPVERSLQWRVRLVEVVSDRCRWNVDVLDWPKSRSVVEGVR